MNIMLTDITTLTLEPQEVPVVVESGTDGFAGLFAQQLPQTFEADNQDIDFKGFLEKLPIQTETSEITPELPLVATDGELPLHHPGVFSRDSNPGISTASEPVDNLAKHVLRPDSNGIQNAPASGEKGERLPIGGNLLPDDAGLEIAKQNMEKAVAPSVTLAAGADTARPASSEVLPAGLPKVTQVPTVAPTAPGVPSLQGIVEKGDVAADFVAVTGKSSVPESDPVIVRDKVVIPQSPGAINKDPLPDTRFVAEAGVVAKTRNPDVATAPPLSRPAELPGLTPQPAIAAVPAAVDQSVPAQRNPRELSQKAIRDHASVPVPATNRVLPLAEKIPVADILAAREMPNISEHRSFENLAQPAANTSQQNAALPTGAVQTFSASPPLAATTQSNAFPTHLETLTLARNADVSELGSGLNERVNWMINQKQNTANIRLDPPFLGKLDVQIRIADEATTVIFQTQHAQTRDLIESASVRLRDFLQESGYQNVTVDVSQRQDQQQARSQTNPGPDADQQDESYQDPDFDHQQRDAVNYFIGDGIVDTFA